MLFNQEAFVIHDGLTSVVRLTADWPQIITLTIVGPDDKEQGQVILHALDDGYQLIVQTGTREQQCLPLLTWPRKGKRVRDIVSRYSRRLSPQAYQVLGDEEIGNLLLSEFRRLLGQAMAYEADPRPDRHKQRGKWQSLYGTGVGIKPPIVQELAAVFLPG